MSSLIVPTIHPKDFTFTFGSKGTSFIFEDLVSKYYMAGEWLKISRQGNNRVFVSKKTIKEMQAEGLRRTKGDSQLIYSKVTSAITDALEKNVLSVPCTKGEVERLFSVMGEIIYLYRYFDIHYWDQVFIQSNSNTALKENCDFVQEKKNFLREQLNPVFFEEGGCLNNVMVALSKHFNIDLAILSLYLCSEILDLFEGFQVSEEVLRERQSQYIVYGEKGAYTMYSGNEIIPILSSFDVIEPLSLIKGVVAHGRGGKVHGFVRLITRHYDNELITRQEMEAMREGDILVTETTDPSLMPAIAKAAAIITDIGGLLSHAAISARELDIPCLIETGSASKILKNGDLVEIDMDKGEVRVITKI